MVRQLGTRVLYFFLGVAALVMIMVIHSCALMNNSGDMGTDQGRALSKAFRDRVPEPMRKDVHR